METEFNFGRINIETQTIYKKEFKKNIGAEIMGEKENEINATKQILTVLKGQGLRKYSEIKEDIEERYESIPSERIMTYNLQKLEDLGMIEKVGERYEYTGELGEGALEDIESMLDRVISVMFEEYGDAIGIENLREVIIEKTEEVIEKNS